MEERGHKLCELFLPTTLFKDTVEFRIFVPNKKKIGPSLELGYTQILFLYVLYMKNTKNVFLSTGASFMIPEIPALDRIIVVI